MKLFQLCFFVVFVITEFVEAGYKYNSTLLKQCKPIEKWTVQGVAFHSSAGFWHLQIQSHVNKREQVIQYVFLNKESDEYAAPLDHLFLTCHCSDTTEDYFFFPASLKINESVSNGIALCVRAHEAIYIRNIMGFVQYYKKISGIYDIRDLYDLLAFKYLTIFPRSILSIDDETNVSSSECLDIYGMPTRKFDGIQSCLVQYLYDSTKEKDPVFKYSGPLLYGNLEWIPEDFLSSINTFVHYKVNKTLPKYCKYDVRNETMHAFTCVCHGDDQKMCRKPLNKRMCAYNFINKSQDVNESAETLFREKCEYSFINRAPLPKLMWKKFHLYSQYEISLGASSDCVKDCNGYCAVEWCSLIDARKNFNEAYKACCNETDFCNAIKVNDLVNSEHYRTNFECMYAGKMIAMAFKYCERYLDLLSNKTVVLNSFIYYELKNVSAANNENCSYLIATLNVLDSITCSEKLYTETRKLQYFYRCKCYENNCDENGKPMELEMRNFAFPDKLSCQSANYSTSEYEMFEKEISLLYDSWTGSLGATCFIEISLKNKIYHIEAKAITDKSTIPKVCLTFPFSPDSYLQSSPGRIRCCTTILKQPQSKSNCTIEFMINEFQKQLKTENAIQQLIGQKGTLKCGKNDCLISDGCYETKEITIIPEENEEITTSLKCVSNIEENLISTIITEPSTTTLSNLDEYGFVCRTAEAKDRCTIVYPHDSKSQPLIVCCCNDGYKILSESDGTFKCPTKLEKLPSKIGKKIESFKN